MTRATAAAALQPWLRTFRVVDLLVRTAATDAELAVSPAPGTPDDTFTLADLVVSVTGRPSPALVDVDGRTVAVARALAAVGLRRGSVLTVDPGGVGSPGPPAPALEVITLAGPGTGRERALDHGRSVIGPGRGRHQLDDGVVDDVRVTVADDDGALDGGRLLDLDDRVLLVRRARPARPAPALGPPSAAGTTAFNRPPRPAPSAPPGDIAVPDAARIDGEPRRFPLLAVAAPLPVGVAMAVMMGQPRFLVFCLLGPVMGLANWLEERRTRSARRTRSTRADDAARRRLTAALTRRHAEDVERARAEHPDVAELLRWMREADARLWERRPGAADFLTFPIGLAEREWAPPLERGSLAGVGPLVTACGPLPCVPVVADLAQGTGIGIVGEANAAAAVARGIVLSATALHGPADLSVVVCADEATVGDWEWIKWLPHSHTRGATAVTSDPDVARRLAGVVAADRSGHVTLVVAVGAGWWRDHQAPLRTLLSPRVPARLVALGEASHLLPATCSTVVDLGPGPRGTVDHLERRQRDSAVALAAVDVDTAHVAARALARFDDPERPDAGDGALPVVAPILPLLGLSAVDPAAVTARWSRAARSLRVPIGIGAHGPVEVDLVADGPHGLVAGTTGSGKSELLRSLIAGLAATMPPEELNVVLVDFKGGAAFDACARLPHTVGLVTDLDDHRAGRVLRCLHAELRIRERQLRTAGVSSLDEYQDLGPQTPLPRLLLVIDEFALLAAQLPDFVPGLVDLAQRGRSLGIHLILATQRPAGVVDHTIKANTNLRIALRVQDHHDSVDVIGTGEAAAISRQRPGRACARFGAGEIVALQTAWSSGAHPPDAVPQLSVRPAVAVRPLTSLERRHVDVATAATADDEPTDLERLVDAIGEAAGDYRPARVPYLDPLPDVLTAEIAAGAATGRSVPLGLVDRPDEQRQTLRMWSPGPDGSLAVYGMAGAGTTSTLLTLAVGAARVRSPDDLHVYAVDADTGQLGLLAGLPHVGAVVRIDETDRLVRLARRLGADLDRRRVHGHAERPTVVVLLDNVGALRQAVDQDRALTDVWPTFDRIIRDGPGLGMCTVVTATHERALPASTSANLPHRLVMALADQHAYASFGFRAAEVPAMVPGRALCQQDRTELQIVAPPADVAAAVAEIAGPGGVIRRRPAPTVDPLPRRVAAADLVRDARRRRDGWVLPVGLDRREGTVAGAEVRGGDTFVVLGPPASGRTTMLRTLAAGLTSADPTVARYAVGPRGRPLGDLDSIQPRRPGDVARWVEALAADERQRVVFVDDADQLGGPSFERLASLVDERTTFVLVSTPEAIRSIGHWSRPLLRTRRGLLLSPSAGDGDLLRVTLPPRIDRPDRGFGLLVMDGAVVPLLCAGGPDEQDEQAA